MKSLWPFREYIEACLYNPSGFCVAKEEVLLFESFQSFFGFRLDYRHQGFRFRFHSPVELEVDGDRSECQLMGSEFSLEMKKFPREMKIRFLNHYEVRLKRCKAKSWLPKKWRSSLLASAATLGVFVSITLFFVFSGLISVELSRLSALDSKSPSLALIEDISIFQNAPMSSGSSPKDSLSAMMSAWDVGRPLKMLQARKKLEVIKPPSAVDLKEISRSLKEIQTKNLSWSTAEDKPLNISDDEIAKAFSGMIPLVKECYDEVLLFDVFSSGAPDISIEIDQSGRLSDLKIRGFKSQKPGSSQIFRSCLKKVYSSIRLPIPNQAFVIEHQLILESNFDQTKGS